MGGLKIFLRTNFKNKSGKQPLSLRYMIDDKSVQLNIGVNIDGKNWNAAKKLVLPPEPELGNKNMLIKNAFLKAEKIIFDHQVTNKYLSCEQFKLLFLIKHESTNCFYEFVEAELKLKKKA